MHIDVATKNNYSILVLHASKVIMHNHYIQCAYDKPV